MRSLRSIIIIFSMLALILLSGCAKVATPVFKAGKSITIYVHYKDKIDTTLNKYYILFHNDSAPRIPFMPIQFVEPGEIPSQPDVDYYGQFYPSWQAYIVLDGNAFYFVAPPFTSEAVPTKEVIATWSGADPNHILINFSLSRLGKLSNRLNFDIVSVDKETKLVKDNLSALNSSFSPYYIFTVSDSKAYGSDEATDDMRGSMDILDWWVLIQ